MVLRYVPKPSNPHDVSMEYAMACDIPAAPKVGRKVALRQCFKTAGVAVIHARRNPGARIFEKVSTLMTRPSVSREINPGSTSKPEEVYQEAGYNIT